MASNPRGDGSRPNPSGRGFTRVIEIQGPIGWIPPGFRHAGSTVSSRVRLEPNLPVPDRAEFTFFENYAPQIIRKLRATYPVNQDRTDGNLPFKGFAPRLDVNHPGEKIQIYP